MYSLPFIYLLLGLLDLVGIIFIGIFGTLSLSVADSPNSGASSFLFNRFDGDDSSFYRDNFRVLIILGIVILLFKTFISLILTKKLFHFLGQRAATISSQLAEKYFARDLLFVNKRTKQEAYYAISNGVDSLTMGVLGNSSMILSDTTLLMILFIGLLIINPIVSTFTLILFGVLGISLYTKFGRKARTLGQESTQLGIQGSSQIYALYDNYREILVSKKRTFFTYKYAKSRKKLSSVLAQLYSIPVLSKYSIESGIILGIISILIYQLWFSDLENAVSTLVIFLAAGSRIAPAVIRILQCATSLNIHLGMAEPSLELLDELSSTEVENISKSKTLDGAPKTFEPRLSLNNIFFQYPGRSEYCLRNISVEISCGEKIVIVGPSGSGKTTLADIILGVLEPTSGEVKISGMSPQKAFTYFPGMISYVPQDVSIFPGTLAENIMLSELDNSNIPNRLKEAIQASQLESFVHELPSNLETMYNQDSQGLSGGQKQRIGIARALYSRPQFIIFDESTSSLDKVTSDLINETINDLGRSVTVLVITHRISAALQFDRLFEMKDGNLVSLEMPPSIS